MTLPPLASPRVAIFCDEVAWGGIVTYCVMLARGLPDHGIEAVLVAPRAAEWHEAANREGVRVLVPKAPPPTAPIALARTVVTKFRDQAGGWYRRLAPEQLRWLLGAWQESLEIRRILALVPADLIHVQSCGGEVAGLAARLRKPRVPVVSTLHFPATMVAESRRDSVGWRLVCGLNMRAFDATIAVAEATLATWESYPGGPVASGRSTIIHNGTTVPNEIPTRAEARAALELSGAGTVLLNVAALVPYKDQRSLLDAAQILRGQGVEFTLLLAGAGPCHEALVRQAAQSGLSECVRFLGHRTDTALLFAAADLCVHSSVEEAFPMVLLESGVQGVPIVATDVGGVGELISEGETASLVAAGQPEALAAAIRQALADRAAASQRAERLSARIRQSFLSEHMLAQTAGLYRELLRTHE